VASEALRWVVYVRGFSEQDKAAALGQMLRDHMGDQRFYDDLYFHLHRPGVDPEKFYRRVLEHPDAPRRVAGLARFSLAEFLKQRGGENAGAEAVRLFQGVRGEYADLPHPFDQQRGTLGNAAELAQFEIEHLQPGKPAPDITGEDVDGERFGLGDYRGKVVMLVFCGDWCLPCRSLYPHEKKLAEKYRDRPFAIIGVNSDSPDALRVAIEREKFPFRWFSDGSTQGPISTRWNVQSWPTIYVVDAAGKIRMKKVGAARPEQIDLMIEQLLAETDRAGDKSSK
jgi:peroxiredoxin